VRLGFPTLDRGPFRCALWVARVRGRIGSLRLLVRVLGVVEAAGESVDAHLGRGESEG